MKQTLIILLSLLLVVSIFGCGKKQELEQEVKPVIVDDGVGDGSVTDTPGDRPDDGNVIVVEAPDFQTVYFDFDKYNLRSDSKAALRHNADEMKNFPSAMIVIEGHCDERGTVEYNLALGEKRARSARDYLVSLGIDANRLSVISYGKERAVAFGHDESAWSQNRRAEFITQ